MKYVAHLETDQIINEGEIPMSNKNPPGRIVSTNNRQDFITYGDMLKEAKEKYNKNMTTPLTSSQKCSVSISYELAIVETPKTPKKQIRSEETNTRKKNGSQ